MRSEYLQYLKTSGWTSKLPSDLDSKNTLVLAFFDPLFSKTLEPLKQLHQAFPKSIVTGCSTAGEIYATQVSEQSISVVIMKFEKADLIAESETIADPNQSKTAGENLGKRLGKPGLKAIFLLSEGIQVNGSELLDGLNQKVPRGVVIAGGLAGDGARFKETHVLVGSNVFQNKICAVGFYGTEVEISAGSLGGWDVFGPERLVTKSKNNILYELDHIPALSLYKDYLGDRAVELPSSALLFPLSLRSPQLERDGLVRTILGIDEKANSMTFAGDIPEGSHARFMKANFTRLIQGASGAALLASKQVADTQKSSSMVAVAISCVGRKLVLGERIQDETEATLSVLPKQTKQVGFYSYGEISPLANGKCDLHNQTMTITVFSEKI